MTDISVELRARLAEQLTAAEVVRSPQWRAAAEAVPRELCLGEAIYRFAPENGGPPWTPLRRSQMAEKDWLGLVYEDQTWVTQVDGVAASQATGPVSGAPTSSSSLPSLVVGMLEDLDVGDHDRVLEIATGTGYSTALLCHRLCGEQVTSVEIDPTVAEDARGALAALGGLPTLLVADGFEGAPVNAPYTRIIATCAFRYLPQPWLYQVEAGAKILLTLAGWMGASAQALLEINDEDTAQGRFLPVDRSFMMARNHLPPPSGPLVFPRQGKDRDTDIGADALSSWLARFVAQLAAPTAQMFRFSDEILLWDVSTGSQAWVRSTPSGGRWSVREHGPVRLWDAVEEAFAAWHAAGTPDIAAFGMTATPDQQRVWLGDPDGPSWRLPV